MRTIFKRAGLKRAGIAAAVAALVAGGAYYGSYYWQTGRFLEETDDAYFQADYTTIAPKVSGYVAAVAVADNEKVKAGQVLARIDDRDFRTALAQAKADVGTAAAAVAAIDGQLAEQQSLIAEATAAVAADEAAAAFARQDSRRYAELARSTVGSVQQAQQTQATMQVKAAALQRDQAGLAAAQQQVAVLKSNREKAQMQLQHYQAIAHQAELNLGYTTIVSPIDGTVGSRTLRVGQYVQAGTQLMAVVPLQSVYVIGNFKETQLTNVRAGQPVDIAVDTYPGVTIRGHVDSLAPASGQTFALLPPDNATGNFTKVVQRIPVKIVIEPDQELAGELRPGMSVEPTIDTKAAVLAAERRATRVAAK